MQQLYNQPAHLTIMLVGALVVIKALYLILLTNFQNTSNKRAGMYKALQIIIYCIVTPALLAPIVSCLLNEIFLDKYITLEKIYWKAAIILFCLFCLAVYYLRVLYLAKKAVRFFRKKDHNETKYQSIFKRTRFLLILLTVMDLCLIAYLKYLDV